MRRRPLLLTASSALAALALAAAPAAAGAATGPAAGAGGGQAVAVAAQQPDAPADDTTQGSEDAPTTTAERVPSQDIIPKPNSGRAPTEAGDRGGALQALVFVLILAGVGGIAAIAVRDARRHRVVAAGDQASGPNSSQAS